MPEHQTATAFIPAWCQDPITVAGIYQCWHDAAGTGEFWIIVETSMLSGLNYCVFGVDGDAEIAELNVDMAEGGVWRRGPIRLAGPPALGHKGWPVQ